MLIVKRALVAVAVAAMTIGIAGCADSATTASPDSANNPAPDKVVIGGLWATSGPSAAYGDWYTNASELAVKEINDAGGLNGQTLVELQIEDTLAQPGPAVVAFQRLLGLDVRFVQSAFSSQTLAIMPIANENEIPVTNGGAQSTHLAETGDFLFNTIPLIYKESEVLAAYLHDEADAESAAVLYTSDDGGEAAYENFQDAFETAGGSVVAAEAGEYQGTDFRSQLTKLKESGADVLIIAAFGLDSNNIISQTREIGWDVQIANTSWVAIPDVLANPAAEGLIHTSIPFAPTDEFVAAYETAYGETPTSGYIGNYYDGVKMWAAAYEAASDGGTKDPSGREVADMIRELKTFDSSYGSVLSFDSQGVADRPISISAINGGKSAVVADDYGN